MGNPAKASDCLEDNSISASRTAPGPTTLSVGNPGITDAAGTNAKSSRRAASRSTKRQSPQAVKAEIKAPDVLEQSVSEWRRRSTPPDFFNPVSSNKKAEKDTEARKSSLNVKKE